MTETTVFEGDDMRRGDDLKFVQPRFGQYLRAVARLDALARQRFGRGVMALALRWVLDTPGVGVTLWGARRPEQVGAIDDAFGLTVDAQTRDAVDRIVELEVHDPIGPQFMAPPEAGKI